MPDPRPKWRGLYLITPTGAASFDQVLNVVAAAVDAGVGLVQYRDKSGSSPRRLREATALGELCAQRDAVLLINDDIALCEASGAHGVHLGRDDASPDHARAVLGPSAVIGVSCYDSLERARRARRSGADYVAFGSVWPSSTKPAATRVTLQTIAQARGELDLPIVAIGGLTPDNVTPVIEAGAHGAAVISAVFDAPNPGEIVRQFLRAIARAKPRYGRDS